MDDREYWFIGECMLELRREGNALFRQSFSGDVYNTAVYFRRAAAGRQTCFVSAVGPDSMSKALLEQAAGHGLSVRYVTVAGQHPPGIYMIETTATGERSFLYWRGESAARRMLDDAHSGKLQDRAMACGILYFSGITLAILDDVRRSRLFALAASVKGNGGWVAFDSNYRPGLWHDAATARTWIGDAVRVATHALMTFDDERTLYQDSSPESTLSRTLSAGPAEAVVKLGKDGCLVQSRLMDRMCAVPAEKVNPVDTTAAGDSFNAAYLAARLGGASPVEAARAGNRLAARVVLAAGAIIDEI